jgi:hypothetical protein
MIQLDLFACGEALEVGDSVSVYWECIEMAGGCGRVYPCEPIDTCSCGHSFVMRVRPLRGEHRVTWALTSTRSTRRLRSVGGERRLIPSPT